MKIFIRYYLYELLFFNIIITMSNKSQYYVYPRGNRERKLHISQKCVVKVTTVSILNGSKTLSAEEKHWEIRAAGLFSKGLQESTCLLLSLLQMFMWPVWDGAHWAVLRLLVMGLPFKDGQPPACFSYCFSWRCEYLVLACATSVMCCHPLPSQNEKPN